MASSVKISLKNEEKREKACKNQKKPVFLHRKHKEKNNMETMNNKLTTRDDIMKAWNRDKELALFIYNEHLRKGGVNELPISWLYKQYDEAAEYYTEMLNNL